MMQSFAEVDFDVVVVPDTLPGQLEWDCRFAYQNLVLFDKPRGVADLETTTLHQWNWNKLANSP